jgi:SAM-dependent methyltransferase
MNSLNKLCDAADWFRPGISDIITNELREVPRFHRKQWEFAMIFQTLRHLGKLTPEKLGLSMGGGKELVAYAIAQHVRQLIITDLYEMNTSWDCAKTESPDEFIRQHKPFAVADEKLKALRMDMRELQFPDNTFDFCYSTCAVEHIGGREDFLRHFNEVARVLNDDGVYVFTTEILYGNDAIRDDHNYVFSLPLLTDILAQSDLAADDVFDAHIAPHMIHFPLPSALTQLSFFTETNLPDKVLQERVHLQLMRGSHPFTCGIFVLHKKQHHARSQRMQVVGLEETREFAEKGVREYEAMLRSAQVSINPFSLLPGAASRFCADHAEFFSLQEFRGDPETPFHTDYFWWGTGKRVFEVLLRVETQGRIGKPEIELRIHRYKTLASHRVECVESVTHSVQQVGWMVRTIQVQTEDEYCYAVLAKIRNGHCTFDRIEVKSHPVNSTAAHVNAEPVHRQLLPV